MNPLDKLKPACRRLLTERLISHQGPGTILSYIQSLIDFIGVSGITTKSKQGNLPAAVLPELNVRLSQPVEVFLDRPLLKNYPNIAGLYVLLRVMDLVRVDARRVWIDEHAINTWNVLNPTEKYFALLEARLLDADGKVLSEASRTQIDGFANTLHFLAHEESETNSDSKIDRGNRESIFILALTRDPTATKSRRRKPVSWRSRPSSSDSFGRRQWPSSRVIIFTPIVGFNSYK